MKIDKAEAMPEQPVAWKFSPFWKMAAGDVLMITGTPQEKREAQKSASRIGIRLGRKMKTCTVDGVLYVKRES